MSSDERSPKRQRGSYSPASPTYQISGLETTPFVNPFVNQTPQTPPPSVRMSPSWDTQQLPSQAAHTTFPTPPSTAGLLSQMRESFGSTDAENMNIPAHHTPAQETEHKVDSDGDIQMEQTGNTELGHTAADIEHRRSDHDRLREPVATVSRTGVEEGASRALQTRDSPVLYKVNLERKIPFADNDSVWRLINMECCSDRSLATAPFTRPGCAV